MAKKYTLLNDGSYRNNETGETGIRSGHWLFEELQSWLDDGNTPDPEFTQEEIDAQELINQKLEAENFLKNSDPIVLRYRDDLASGRTPFMPEAKYLNLLKKRARAQKLIGSEIPDY
jgi:hypothetical protein